MKLQSSIQLRRLGFVRYGDENGIKIQWKIEMKGHGGENEIAKPCLIENAKKAGVGWIWR